MAVWCGFGYYEDIDRTNLSNSTNGQYDQKLNLFNLSLAYRLF
jgi:hypothetical protein